MTLEKYTKHQNRNSPLITIRKDGTVCINRAAREQFKLSGHSYVTLHYDRSDSTMHIKPCGKGEDGAFDIHKEKGGRTFTVICPDFLRDFGIQFQEETRRYPATWDEKGKMIVVKLK
jgi:hypothetical protein